jgi:hypothetical protein
MPGGICVIDIHLNCSHTRFKPMRNRTLATFIEIAEVFPPLARAELFPPSVRTELFPLLVRE